MEKQEKLATEEETTKIINLGVGEDTPQLQAKPVRVGGFKIVKVPKTENMKTEGQRLVIFCIHPEQKDKPIEIGNVKHESEGRIKQSGLWIQNDNTGAIKFKSALSTLMRFYNVKTINELLGKELQTTTDDNKYLIIKAY